MDVSNYTLGKYFIFNGIPSYNYRLICSGGGTYSAPKRAYDTVNIPGRNGELLIDKGYYDNTNVSYSVTFFDDKAILDERHYYKNKPVDRNYFESSSERSAAIKDWLYSPIGYRELSDTWHKDEYRLAYVSNDFDPDMLDSLEAGSVKISFTCKPQRFLTSGKAQKTLTIGTKTEINNPTSFEAIPEFILVGNGTLEVSTYGNDGSDFTGSNAFTLTVSNNASSTLYLDCDLMDAYGDNYTNLNSRITYNNLSADRIFIGSGTDKNKKTYITAKGFTSAKYIPHYWRL